MDTPNDIDKRLADNKDKLIPALSKFHGKPPEEVKHMFDDVVSMTKPLAVLKQQEVSELLALLEEKEQLEAQQKKPPLGSEHYT